MEFYLPGPFFLNSLHQLTLTSDVIKPHYSQFNNKGMEFYLPGPLIFNSLHQLTLTSDVIKPYYLLVHWRKIPTSLVIRAEECSKAPAADERYNRNGDVLRGVKVDPYTRARTGLLECFSCGRLLLGVRVHL